MRCDTSFLEQPVKGKPRLVLAHHSEQSSVSAERSHVACDVRRTTKALLAGAHTYYGHRCLRRNALDLAKPVTIEHDIAGNEQSAMG